MSQSFVFCPNTDCEDVIWYDDDKGREQAIEKHRAIMHKVSPEPTRQSSETHSQEEVTNAE